MTFGAIIAAGQGNQLMPERLMECLTEVRVEQTLGQATRFAMRFQEDIDRGRPTIMPSPELKAESMISIAAPSGNEMKCLVRGPITEHKCSVKLGGQGSTFEIRGEDRRVELDRECRFVAWSARASEAAQTILEGYDFEVEAEQTTRVYSEDSGTLNQRYTDLQFIERIACENNLLFRITYSCELNGLDPTRQTLKVVETAHLASSPPRGDQGAGGLLSAVQNQLSSTEPPRLRVNVDKDQCQNVTAFDIESDFERPNSFNGSAVNARSVSDETTSASDPQPLIRQGGSGVSALAQSPRTVCVTTAGDSEELNPKAQALLTEAGWFVNATASTTAHMLGGVLIPDDVVQVDGLGTEQSGPYQVKTVTHVITAADHFMDLQLRRNAQGGG